MSLIGYKRVSSDSQSTDRQDLGELDKVFEEKLSGKSAKDRPALQAMIEYAREGDTLVVTRLDRLARSQADLHQLLNDLSKRSIGFECTEQPEVNTTGPMGKLLLGVLGAVAEFETGLRSELQMEGIVKAKAAGKYKGFSPSRPRRCRS